MLRVFTTHDERHLTPNMMNDDPNEKPGPPAQPPTSDGMSMSFGMPSDGGHLPPKTGGDGDAGTDMHMHTEHLEIQTAPFRMIVLDGFFGDAPPPEHAVPVTAASLDDAMNSTGVRIAIEVPNHLASKPKQLTAELRFASLRDFRPKVLLTQVAELRATSALLDRLADLRAGRTSPAQIEAELSAVQGLDALIPALNLALQQPATPGSAPPAADDPQAIAGRKLLDELLGDSHGRSDDENAPSTPAKTTPPPKPQRSALDSVVGSMQAKGGSSNGASIAQAIESIHALLCDQLQEVLQAPGVRAIEQAWRGLQVLTTQASGAEGQPLRFEILQATADDFATVFANAVHAPECAGETQHALSMTVLGCPVQNNAAQLQAIREVQQQSEDLQAPVLWSMADDFFGERAAQLAARDSVGALLSSDALAKWRGLRSDDAARWSAACCNRYLLRDLHNAPLGAGSFAERGEHLWGSPSYFVAALIARSVVATGWPTQFTGLRAGSIAGRPLADQLPVEAAFGEATIEALAEAGIMTLTCVRGRDEVVLLRAPSIHEAAQFGNREQANQDSHKLSSLPYQLLAARIAEATLRHKSALVVDNRQNVIKRRFEQFFAAFLGATGPGAAASVTIEPKGDDHWVHCTVRTGDRVLGGTELQFTLRA